MFSYSTSVISLRANVKNINSFDENVSVARRFPFHTLDSRMSEVSLFMDVAAVKNICYDFRSEALAANLVRLSLL